MTLIEKENADMITELLRPVDIKEDVILMKQRQRVSKILHSDAFHKELNKILDQQMKEGSVCGGKAGAGSDAAAVAALQEISNLLLPHARLGSSVFNRDARMPIVPINDMKPSDKHITKQEKLIRCKLASIYRLIDLHGWASGMVMHASGRMIKDENVFLTNCHGLMNHEIQASTLVKVNLEGDTIDENESSGIIDSNSWAIHASIHNADPSYRCVLHVRTPSVVAVSCMKSGLQKVCEESIMLGEVSVCQKLSEMSNNLMVNNVGAHCVLVRNQGLWARGHNIEEAWQYLRLGVHSCEVQVRLASSHDNVTLDNLPTQKIPDTDKEEAKNACLVQFDALMRALDATGHRTGHLYRFAPILFDKSHHQGGRKKPHMSEVSNDDGNLADREDDDEDDEDVEVPPSATSFSTKQDSSEPFGIRGPQEPRWLLHMPNDYVRTETEEPGPNMSHQKRVVTWQQLPPESRNTSGLVETCTTANQFAPLGTDPNELKQQQMKVKSKYFNDLTTAGHQSKVLRGLDESKGQGAPASAKMDVSDSMPTDESGRVVLVGAVSKGIIDKKHRKDPSVYQSCFSPNPFDRVTEEELKQYERRVLGLPTDEEEPASAAPTVNVIESADLPTVNDVMESKIATQQETVPHDKSHDQLAETTEAAPSTLSPDKPEMLRSDTSGADMSHDDTEREGQKSTGGKKKRKKLKEMFSFRKKDKSK